MSVCFLCNSEFSLPKHPSKRKLLIYNENSDDDNDYMCQDCFEERAYTTSRYLNGDLLCATLGCAKSVDSSNKYCNECKYEYE